MVRSRVALGRGGHIRQAQIRCVTRLKRQSSHTRQTTRTNVLLNRDLGGRGVTRLPRRTHSLFGEGNNKETNGDADKNPFSNFSELLKTAQDARARASVEAQKAQEELSKVEFEGYDEDELVRVVVTGNQEPKSVELTESVLELELDEIQEHLIQAMKEAHSKSVMGMKDRMQQLYTDLGFPMPPQQ